MEFQEYILYFIIAILAITFAKNLIYIVSGPFYSIFSSRLLKNSKNLTKKEIENKIKISVIVPARNEEVGVLNSVKSLLNSSYNNLELILVDDGSTDNTPETINDFINTDLHKYLNSGKSFKYFRKENGGKGSALNYGIVNSTGDIVVTMDADTIFDKNSLFEAAQYFINNDIDAAVGNIKVGNPNSLLGFIQQLEYVLGFFFKRTHSLFNAEYIISGAFGVFRREIFEKYGYFDEANKTEDIEMSMRLQANECKIVYMERAIAYTEAPAGLIGLMKQRLRWKKGRLDAFYTHRQLFFSFNKKHNKFLSFYLLPTTFLYEILLLVEPFLLVMVSAYLLKSGKIEALLFWFLYIGVVHIFANIFGNNKNRLRLFLSLPIYIVLSYILVFIEVYAAYASLKLLLSKRDIKWQTWNRKGISKIYTTG